MEFKKSVYEYKNFEVILTMGKDRINKHAKIYNPQGKWINMLSGSGTMDDLINRAELLIDQKTAPKYKAGDIIEYEFDLLPNSLAFILDYEEESQEYIVVENGHRGHYKILKENLELDTNKIGEFDNEKYDIHDVKHWASE